MESAKLIQTYNFLLKDSSIQLPTQFTQRLDIHRFCISIYHNDNSQSDSDFRCCQGHDEKDEHLSVRITPIRRKSCQQQINRIQHQFDGHHDDDYIPTDKHTRNTDSEHNTTKNDVVVERNTLNLRYNILHYAFLISLTSFFANSTAPIIAISNKIAEISKGSRNSLNNTLPKCFTRPISVLPVTSSLDGSMTRKAPRSVANKHIPAITPIILTRFDFIGSVSSFRFSSMRTNRKSTIIAPIYTIKLTTARNCAFNKI